MSSLSLTRLICYGIMDRGIDPRHRRKLRLGKIYWLRCFAIWSKDRVYYKKATHGIRIHQEIINMQTTYNAIQTYSSSPHQRLQRHFEGVIYPMNPWRLSSSLYCCLCVSARIRHQTISTIYASASQASRPLTLRRKNDASVACLMVDRGRGVGVFISCGCGLRTSLARWE